MTCPSRRSKLSQSWEQVARKQNLCVVLEVFPVHLAEGLCRRADPYDSRRGRGFDLVKEQVCEKKWSEVIRLHCDLRIEVHLLVLIIGGQ